MAMLVGIDEAGYGPHLGPLVVAAAALEFRGDDLPDPDLWPSLKSHVRKRPAGSSSRVVICDSKQAYRSGNPAALERAVLGFLTIKGIAPRSFAGLLAAVSLDPASLTDGGGPPPFQPWDRPESLALPMAAEMAAIEEAADHLAKGLEAIGGAAGGLWVNAASAARLNRLMEGDLPAGRHGRNKADALFALTADLLLQVRKNRPHERIHITMDRHGGRRYYAGLLAGAFPMTTVETVEETPAVSRYRLSDGTAGATVDLTVCERCETWSLPTALASMAAKYVRELYMLQFNAYFQSLVPGVRPTAGYGRDAWRFLNEVASAQASAGVPRGAILRNR
jgi:hypothetical protein